jgi:hypothetical protein
MPCTCGILDFCNDTIKNPIRLLRDKDGAGKIVFLPHFHIADLIGKNLIKTKEIPHEKIKAIFCG